MPEGATRSIGEIIGDVGVMIVGGFQEPAHGAANSLHGLFTRPDQVARFAADPSAWSTPAVEEGLRWLAPFGMTEKLTTTDVSVGAVRLPAGTEGALVLGSANRDETRFGDPDVFDLDRPRQSHASFGYGVHFCLGHYVARQLERVMLEEMFARLPNLDPIRTRKQSSTAGRSGRPTAADGVGCLTFTPYGVSACGVSACGASACGACGACGARPAGPRPARPRPARPRPGPLAVG